jgi:hypothetical protein
LPQLTTENIPTPEFRPDQGHAGNRLQIAGGYDGSAPYTQLGFRWSYHDLSDPTEGFVQGSQVEFFKPTLRYYPQQQHFSFESFDFIKINSMPAANSFMKPFSWQVSLGANRYRFPQQQRLLVGAVKVGAGLSYVADEKLLLSASALSSLLFSDKFHQDTAIGFGTSLYGQYDVSTRWRMGFDATFLQYVQGISQTVYSYSIMQRLSVLNNQAIVLNVGKNNEFDHAAFNASLAWQLYF